MVRNGITRSNDGGKTWAWLRSGLRSFNGGYPEVWDISIHPAGYSTAVFAATLDSPGPVTGSYPSSIGGVYKSADGGNSWVRTNCGLTNSRAVSIFFDPNNFNNLVLGIEGGTASFSQLLGQYFDGGLFRSTDGGTNWNLLSLPTNYNKNGYWHLRSYGLGSTSYLTFGFNFDDLAENVGFLRGTDSGAAWSPLNTSLKNLLITFFDISTDGTRIVAVERDAFSIRKSDDSGQTFTSISADVNRTIKISPENKDIILYVSNGKIYRSSDGLTSIDNNGQPVLTATNDINDIEFAPSNPNIVYAVEVGYNVWKSTDKGLTFSLMGNLRTDIFSKYVSLSLNGTRFSKSSTLTLSANTTTTGSLSTPVDAYVVVRLADGALLYLQPDGSLSPNVAPVVSNWTVREFSGSIFSYTFNGKEIAGTYIWIAGLTSPGTLNVIGSTSSASFEFSQ